MSKMRASKWGGMSIKLKLSLSFIFLLVMMCISGTGGLFYIAQIKGNIATLTDTATPLFEVSNDLLAHMQAVSSNLLELLRSADGQEIETKSGEIQAVQNDFDQALEKLRAIITEGSISLSIEDLIKAKDSFFQKIPQIIKAYQLKLSKEAALREQVSQSEKLHSGVDQELAGLLARGKAAMTEKEDRGKTMVQSGSATVKDMEAILSELFNQDYYVVDGATSLRTYLVQLNGLARTYAAEQDPGRLGGTQKKYETLVKKFKSRFKRLKSRLKTDEDKAAYKKITQDFASLENNTVGEKGSFGTHRDVLNIVSQIRDQRTSLDETTHTFRLALKDVSTASTALIEDAKALTKRVVGQAKINIAVLVAASIVIGIVIGFFIIRTITGPLSRAVDFVGNLSAGDLTQALDIRHNDETGVLMNSLNSMAANLRKIFQDFSDGVKTLISSSGELSKVSEQIYSNSEVTAQKSDLLTTSTEEMNASMNEVASVSEQAAANIQTIASAVEEMTATIRELAGNTTKGNEITFQAVEMAQTVTEKVDNLGKAVSQINQVTETINDISEQTNLLALNATIEASRAGEAGKGFAVVAGEIKSLAHQTAQATLEINGRISEVKTTTDESVAVIESIIGVIKETNTIVSAISAAIEEQSSTTNEISSNINQAAAGVQSINEKISRVSVVTGEIAQDISEVHRINQENRASGQQIKNSSGSLAGLAAGINEMVGQFKI